MIVFDLKCPKDHVFEAWFRDSKAFERQRKADAIGCPVCGATRIDKAPMAPNVATHKGRGETPYRWGVTANVLERLNAQSLPWTTVLLYESKDNGYLLTSTDTLYCAQSIWPLGTDGDYKPGAGSYLSRATVFSSVNGFLGLL